MGLTACLDDLKKRKIFLPHRDLNPRPFPFFDYEVPTPCCFELLYIVVRGQYFVKYKSTYKTIRDFVPFAFSLG